MKRAKFVWGAEDIEDVKNSADLMSFETSVPIIIEKVVELYEAEYQDWTRNLQDGKEFIFENSELTYVDTNGTWHCIFVKPYGVIDGLLVMAAGGFSEARYTAYHIDDSPTVAPEGPRIRFSEPVKETLDEGIKTPQEGTGASTRAKKQIVIRLDEHLHTRLKVYAAEHSTNIQKLVERYLESLIAE